MRQLDMSAVRRAKELLDEMLFTNGSLKERLRAAHLSYFSDLHPNDFRPDEQLEMIELQKQFAEAGTPDAFDRWLNRASDEDIRTTSETVVKLCLHLVIDYAKVDGSGEYYSQFR